MAEQIAISEEPQPPRFGDAFVIFAVTVLSVAIGAWLLLQLKVPLWSGTVAALCAYMLLLSLHLLLRRAFLYEVLAPAVDDGSWVSHTIARAEAPQLPLDGGEMARRLPAGAERSPGPPPAPRRPPEAPQPYRGEPARAKGPAPGGEDLARGAGRGSAPREPALRDQARDAFHFRPSREPAFPPLARRPSGPPPAPSVPSAPPPAPHADPAGNGMSVEAIQDLIKKLADELNNTPAEGASPSGSQRGGSAETRAAAAAREAPPTRPAAGAQPRAGEAAAAPSAASNAPLARAAAAPREAPAARPAAGAQPRAGEAAAAPSAAPNAPLARAAAAPREAPAARPVAGAQPRTGEAQSMPSAAANAPLARVAEAVTAQRVEILLEPIHALVEGRPRHVEVSMRLVTADGTGLAHAEVSRAARGSALMPRIDALRVNHAMRVARRLGDRGRQGSVLVLVDGQSLVDEAFLAAAASEAGTAVSKRLVLCFAQAAVRAFSTTHAEVLKTLVRAGLRFALEEVADLDMDFAALKGMGFDFLKLDAQHFLEGLPVAGGRLPASDLCRHLADFGLTLIVGRIEDEWLLARILGFGVLFGKGALFGAPRVVRDEGGVSDAAAPGRS